MKKRSGTLLLVISIAALLALRGGHYPAFMAKAPSVQINYSKKVLTKGQKVQLRLFGVKSKVKWSSSKRAVASVSGSGKVTALKKGEAIITAQADHKKYTCSIIVKPAKGTKSNPYSAYDERRISYYHPSLKTNCTFLIHLLDYKERERGSGLMKIYSPNNPSPGQGKKWVVMKFEIKYEAGPQEAWPAAQILNPQTSFYSQNGKKRLKSMAAADFGIFENNDICKTTLILNQTAEVLLAILTDESNGYPLYRIPTGRAEGNAALRYIWFTTKR